MSRLSDKQLSEFIEDVRKLWSPDKTGAEGSFAPATLLGHNVNKPKPMNATKTNGRGTPMGYINKIEAASVMGCTVRSIDNLMKSKLIPHYKFGRAVYFKESDLMESIEKHKVS